MEFAMTESTWVRTAVLAGEMTGKVLTTENGVSLLLADIVQDLDILPNSAEDNSPEDLERGGQ
jgi:hypothetical protein